MPRSCTAPLLFILLLSGILETGTAYAAGGESEFSSPNVSWYRQALGDIGESIDRGASVSVSVEELQKKSATEAAIRELFDLYEKSDFDAALGKITILNRQLRETTDRQGKISLASLLDFKGVIRQRKGELIEAAIDHGEALKLLEGLGLDSSLQGIATRNNLAVAQYLRGDYVASEKILTAIADDQTLAAATRARARNNRALIYTDLGFPDKALLDLSHAEDDARAGKSDQLLAQILNNEGRGFAARNNNHKAQAAFSEALQLAEKSKDMALQADILDSWGEMLVNGGEFNAALDKLTAASRAESKANAPLIKVTILKNRGRALAGLGKTEQALSLFNEALELATDKQLASQRRDILSNRSRLYAGMNDLNAAIADLNTAIALVEKTRERLSGESETAFIKTTSMLYREMVELLLKRKLDGDAEAAFAMLERSRSAMLQEQMANESPALRDKQAEQDITGARGILRQEAALAKKLQTALSASNPDPQEIALRRQQLDVSRANAEKALSELSDKYQGRYDRFVPSAVDPKYLKDIAKLLPAKSLLVSYSYGEDGLYIFLVSADGKIDFRQNPHATKADLETGIETYRALVTKIPGKSQDDWRIDSWSEPKWIPLRDSTARLYQQLLAPIADRLQQVDQVIFAPTGKMYYLPFHALGQVDQSGSRIQYLALTNKVSYVSHSSLLKAFGTTRDAAKSPRILAFGDVQFGDDSELELLDASKHELASIKGIFGRNAVLLENKAATKDNLLAALRTGQAGARRAAKNASASGFNFMLISTHGILQTQEPGKSYLAMENNKQLTAQEIGSLDLHGISLVTLSACDTWLATENPGADLMSLGEHVLLAGASSVLATLWKVDDFQTANLMKVLYTRLRQTPNDKTAALQLAQIALASKPESTHPFFWSPFVLYGRGW